MNQTKCLEVDRGTYQDEEGQSDQKYCPSGHVSNVTGSIRCQPCPIGYYMPYIGQAECSAADLGHYVENEASDKQDECHEGFVSAKIGSSFCKPCQEMMFQNRKGKTSCKPCEEIDIMINDGAFKESGSHQLVSYPGSDNCFKFCKSADYYNKEQNKCVPSPFRVESGDILAFFVSNSSGTYFIKTNGEGIELRESNPPNAAPGPHRKFEILSSDKDDCFVLKSVTTDYEKNYWRRKSGSNWIEMKDKYLDANSQYYRLAKFKFVIIGDRKVMIRSCVNEGDHSFLNSESGGQLFFNSNHHYWEVF